MFERCLNCGSTAHPKLIFIEHITQHINKEIYECGCGCRIERRMAHLDTTYWVGHTKLKTFKGEQIK